MFKQILYSLIVLAALTRPALCQPPSALTGFVLIKGGEFHSGDVVTVTKRPLVRVDDFEMLDHPVTNAEYKKFIDASGHAAPLHWRDGKIPPGKEEYPVIFVNREDVNVYLHWLSQQDGRVYRLPTTCEFEYASRGGLQDKKFPWGDGDAKNKANYDAAAERRFDDWEKYLQPAVSNKANGFKLYGMAGNVWHMTVDLLDPVTTLFKYRMYDIPSLEGSRMGGSWARSGEYLRCGNYSELSSGIRHPDVGFRPIRNPQNQDWREQPRRLVGQSLGHGRVFLGWALLSGENQTSRFNVYRSLSRNHAGFLINKAAIQGKTGFIDENLAENIRYHYYIKTVDQNGQEGRRSPWIGVTVTAEPAQTLVTFAPLCKQGSLTPVFGDLDGDKLLDCVIRINNGNEEMSQDPGTPVQLEAFTSWGRSLWRKDICFHDHCFGSANNVPFNVYDLDTDGKADIITRLQIGDSVFVAILDGMSGRVKNKTPWPEMVTDLRRSSTRIHMAIAYLDGVHPAIITQTGLYENEVFVAFDANLKKLWQFNSFAETNGSGGHSIEVADVDGDGKQEIFDGTTCLNHDGSVRWSIYRQHPDKVSIQDYLPDRPGLEVCYLVESNAHAGIYMVDAQTGKIIWKHNRDDDPRWTHGHYGWNADFWDAHKGIECIVTRSGHSDHSLVLYSADGKILMDPFPGGYVPVEWDGDPYRELLGDNGHTIGKFDGKTVIPITGEEPNPIKGSSLIMQADLYGDFRDELILQTPATNGRTSISIVTATTDMAKALISAQEDLDYQLWLARNMGGGYRTYFEYR